MGQLLSKCERRILLTFSCCFLLLGCGLVSTVGAAESSEGEWESENSPAMFASWRRNWSQRDTQRYRAGYPGQHDDPTARKNLQFYSNERASVPEGDRIGGFRSLFLSATRQSHY